MPNYDYEQIILKYMENIKAQLLVKPLNLGGVEGLEGGTGGPAGGFMGHLPQKRVAYDYSEIASSGILPSGASLVDNLNHIRYRLQSLESGITISGGNPLVIYDNGSVVTNEASSINFSGFVVTNVGNDVTIKNTGVVSSGNFDANNLGYIELLHNNGVTLYPATTVGFSGALGNARYGDSVFINSCTISGAFLVNSGIVVDGRGNSTINGYFDVYKNSTIRNLFIDKQDHNTTDVVYGIRLPLLLPDIIWQDNVQIENCDITIRNLNATPGEYACIYVDGASYVTINNCKLTSYRNGIHVSRGNSENYYSDNYIAASNYGIYSSIGGTCYSVGNYYGIGTNITNDSDNVMTADIDRSNFAFLVQRLSLGLKSRYSTKIGFIDATTLTTADRFYTFPDKDGTVAMLDDISAGSLVGSGLANRIPKWEDVTTIRNSNLIDAIQGGAVTLSGTLTADREISFPNNNGMLALLSDIPTIPPIPSLAGYVYGNGTAGYLPKWITTSGIGDSNYYSGSPNVINGNISVSGNVTLTNQLTTSGIAIGTTSPLYPVDIRGNLSPMHFSLTDVDSGGYFVTAGTNNFFMAGGTVYVGGGVWKAKDTSAGIMGTSAGKFTFYGDTGLTVGSGYSPTANVTLLANGNLGIGVINPQSKLDVNGNTTVSGTILVTNSSAGIGYATGVGSTVTQATNKLTGVTLNRPTGKIIMHSSGIAASSVATFVLTNSTIAATDLLVLNHVASGTAGAYSLNGQCRAGTANINVRNLTGGTLSEAIILKFAVIKSSE